MTAHEIDYKIYGEEIEVEFIRRIRSEQEFASAEELVKQIEKDIQAAKNVLKELL